MGIPVTFDNIAKQTFQILRSFDYEVLLFDDEGNKVFEPADARRFFATQENLLVSLIDDGDNSAVRLFLSPSTAISSVMRLVTTLRTMATKYNKLFRLKTNDSVIKPKDFSTRSSVGESLERTMNILEGLYGTSRSSYLKLENARMIVRHSARINENSLGARGRNIDSIHIENGVGERVLFPTTQLAPARAMTHHVNNGGSWGDQIGEQINRMAQDFAHLGAASRHIYTCSNELAESAMVTRETIREGVREMRKTFESLCRKTRYSEICEQICQSAPTLTEGAETDLSEQISALGAVLNTPTVSLSEAVLASVVKMMEGRPSAEDRMTYIGLLGDQLKKAGLRDQAIKVNKEAWDNFRSHDALDLSGQVSYETSADADDAMSRGREIGTRDSIRAPAVPQFTDPMGRHCYLLSQIAEKCRDASMGNLLSFISEERPHVKDTALGNIFDVIAKKAFKAANVDPEKIKIRQRNPQMATLQDWFDGFTAEQTLVEYDRFAEPDDATANHNDAAMDRVISDFDLNAFLASDDAAHFVDGEIEIDRSDLAASIAHYLEIELEDRHDATGIDMQAAAEGLLRTVIPDLEAEGYEISGSAEHDEEPMMMMAAEDEGSTGPILSKEDVLLPKKKGDLIHDVTPATVEDPYTGEEEAPDDAYIQRLQSLSGIRNRY